MLHPVHNFNDSYLDGSTIAVTMDISSELILVQCTYSDLIVKSSKIQKIKFSNCRFEALIALMQSFMYHLQNVKARLILLSTY